MTVYSDKIVVIFSAKTVESYLKSVLNANVKFMMMILSRRGIKQKLSVNLNFNCHKTLNKSI